MGELLEFAVVVGTVLVAALGWRWGTYWIDRLRGETTAEIEALEERVSELEAALERSADRTLPPPAASGDVGTDAESGPKDA